VEEVEEPKEITVTDVPAYGCYLVEVPSEPDGFGNRFYGFFLSHGQARELIGALLDSLSVELGQPARQVAAPGGLGHLARLVREADPPPPSAA
jgi:hypothetical protein